MTLCTRCLRQLTSKPIRYAQWHQITRRSFSSDTDSSIQLPSSQAHASEDPIWFQELRKQMLHRKLPIAKDRFTKATETKLAQALSSFLPREWCHTLESTSTRQTFSRSIGHHLVICNPSLSEDTLLPDGTDNLHSPGGTFVRRMWAGGALEIHPRNFLNGLRGWELGRPFYCEERIKEVRLRGQGDDAKIFVTIERKFTRGGKQYHSGQEDWGPAILREDRDLVFMPARTAEALEAVKAGNIPPTKYLESLGTPDISHTLTPTDTLLFCFSALTYNAHRIHLDRNYARNNEGHRNLLVHGPLTLLLMLKLVNAHLCSLSGAQQIIRRIQYRNLAPLYCDEKLRVCAREKKNMRTEEGRTYDVWIEGPSGGMAVKGIMQTAVMPEERSSPRGKKKSYKEGKTKKDFGRGSQQRSKSGNGMHSESNSKLMGGITKPKIRRLIYDADAAPRIRRISSANVIKNIISTPRVRRNEQHQPKLKEAQPAFKLRPLVLPPIIPSVNPPSGELASTEAIAALPRLHDSQLRLARQARKAIVQFVHAPRSMHPTMTARNRAILRRTRISRIRHSRIKPLPLVRFYNRSLQTELRWSIFAKYGIITAMYRNRVRHVGQGLEKTRRAISKERSRELYYRRHFKGFVN